MAGTNYDAVVPEALRKHVEGITPSPEHIQPYRWPEIVRSLVLAAYAWHKMEYAKLSFAERLDLMKEVLRIEPQVLLETLGQNHPVHYYLSDVDGDDAPMVDAKPETHDSYAQNEEGGRIYQTHERPYVVPTRKAGEIVMLVGKTEVRLAPIDAAHLGIHLLLVGSAAPSVDDRAQDRTVFDPQRLSLRVVVKDDDGDQMTTGVKIEGPTPNGHVTFVGDKLIADRLRARALDGVRKALGIIG